VSNKFKVGDVVMFASNGACSARGVIKKVIHGSTETDEKPYFYDIEWHYSHGTTPMMGFAYQEHLLDYYSNHPDEVKKRKETQVKKLEDYLYESTQTITKTVTPESVYNYSKSLQNVRDMLEKKGLEITDFRPPIDGDIYIAAAHGTTTETADKGDWRPKEPRFIVTRPRSISDTEIINFIERNRMGWGLTNDGYVFSYMGHHREEGKNFREAIIKHIRREERKES